MKSWEDRFFALNKEVEVELTGIQFNHAIRAISTLGWQLDDQFWAPDLSVSRYLLENRELFLIEETYFGPKLTGISSDISKVSEEAKKIDPNEKLFAGGAS